MTDWTGGPTQMLTLTSQHRMSRMYFLRKLRSFNVFSKMSEIFYQSAVVPSVLLLSAGGSASVPEMPVNAI